MRLEIENSPPFEITSREALQKALALVGKGDHGFAVLQQENQIYIQTIGTKLKGFQIEVRDGSEDRHYYSKNAYITHSEMIDIFLSYFDGKADWKTSLLWNRPVKSPQIKRQHKSQLATYRNAAITLVTGALMFWGSEVQRHQTEDLERHLGSTTGTVLSSNAGSHGSKTSVSWLNITVRYTANGKEFVAKERLSGKTYLVGDVVPVVYDKRDPSLIQYIRGPWEIWREYYFFLFVSLLLGAISIVFTMLAMKASFSSERRTRRQ